MGSQMEINAVIAQQECLGQGEGGYSCIGGCEVFSEGILDLLLVVRVNGYWLEGDKPEHTTSVFSSCSAHLSSIETQSQTRRYASHLLSSDLSWSDMARSFKSCSFRLQRASWMIFQVAARRYVLCMLICRNQHK